MGLFMFITPLKLTFVHGAAERLFEEIRREERPNARILQTLCELIQERNKFHIYSSVTSASFFYFARKSISLLSSSTFDRRWRDILISSGIFMGGCFLSARSSKKVIRKYNQLLRSEEHHLTKEKITETFSLALFPGIAEMNISIQIASGYRINPLIVQDLRIKRKLLIYTLIFLPPIIRIMRKDLREKSNISFIFFELLFLILLNQAKQAFSDLIEQAEIVQAGINHQVIPWPNRREVVTVDQLGILLLFPLIGENLLNNVVRGQNVRATQLLKELIAKRNHLYAVGIGGGFFFYLVFQSKSVDLIFYSPPALVLYLCFLYFSVKDLIASLASFYLVMNER